MEGYDKVWRNSDNSRTASYKGLPTGRYTFKVKAFLLESPERADIRELVIVVPPHFFMSSNAIWLYMVLAAALGIYLMLWRQRRLRLALTGSSTETDEDANTGITSVFRSFWKRKKQKVSKAEDTDYYEILD